MNEFNKLHRRVKKTSLRVGCWVAAHGNRIVKVDNEMNNIVSMLYIVKTWLQDCRQKFSFIPMSCILPNIAKVHGVTYRGHCRGYKISFLGKCVNVNLVASSRAIRSEVNIYSFNPAMFTHQIFYHCEI